MAKASGLGITTLSVDDSAGTARAIINDITEFSFSTPRGEFDWTGVDKSAMERGQGLADFEIELSGVWNVADTTSAFAVFKTVSSSTVSREVTLVVAAKSLVNECFAENWEVERGADGDMRWSSTLKLNSGTVPTWT